MSVRAVLGVIVLYACTSLRVTQWHSDNQADCDVSRCLPKRHYFVTSNEVIEHILPNNSGIEHLINYCILFKQKT